LGQSYSELVQTSNIGVEVMACKYCGKPVVLVPSAKERAANYGKSPGYYTMLFPNHQECEAANRDEAARQLMADYHNGIKTGHII
jgi:hypothetical protein